MPNAFSKVVEQRARPSALADTMDSEIPL